MFQELFKAAHFCATISIQCNFVFYFTFEWKLKQKFLKILINQACGIRIGVLQ